MHVLHRISKKKKRRIIGLMSGTSCDGIDLAVVDISGHNKNSDIDVLHTYHVAYSEEQKKYLLGLTESKESGPKQISQVNFYLAKLWAAFIQHMLKRARIDPKTIDLIGSHGHTIYHQPQEELILEQSVRSTLQCGDPAVMAQICGISTVGDFRVADMARGGQGAPLVPYLDWILFAGSNKDTIALNIGGISNITYIPSNGNLGQVMAFDTGPGNMIIDQLMRRFYERPFDRDGKIANLGTFSTKVFEYLQKTDSFPKQKPPKSTGREHYGSEFVIELRVCH
jgi:anhydro-N-acetylmuramic acid kinase